MCVEGTKGLVPFLLSQGFEHKDSYIDRLLPEWYNMVVQDSVLIEESR